MLASYVSGYEAPTSPRRELQTRFELFQWTDRLCKHRLSAHRLCFHRSLGIKHRAIHRLVYLGIVFPALFSIGGRSCLSCTTSLHSLSTFMATPLHPRLLLIRSVWSFNQSRTPCRDDKSKGALSLRDDPRDTTTHSVRTLSLKDSQQLFFETNQRSTGNHVDMLLYTYPAMPEYSKTWVIPTFHCQALHPAGEFFFGTTRASHLHLHSLGPEGLSRL